MKAVSLVKKEIMEYNVGTYLTWLFMMAFGVWTYFNTPAFIIHANMLNIFIEALKGIWSLALTSIMGWVGVIVVKSAGKWWDETGNGLYEKWFGKKKNP